MSLRRSRKKKLCEELYTALQLQYYSLQLFPFSFVASYWSMNIPMKKCVKSVYTTVVCFCLSVHFSCKDRTTVSIETAAIKHTAVYFVCVFVYLSTRVLLIDKYALWLFSPVPLCGLRVLVGGSVSHPVSQLVCLFSMHVTPLPLPVPKPY